MKYDLTAFVLLPWPLTLKIKVILCSSWLIMLGYSQNQLPRTNILRDLMINVNWHGVLNL